MRILTLKQKQVLKHLSEGLTYKETAETLNLSDRTVQKYIKVVMTKMDAKNTAHAIYKGAKAGII